MKFYDETNDKVFKKYYTHSNGGHDIGSCYSKDSVFNHKAATLDLSVIVPCYNGETYIKKCLDAITKQETGYSYEVILVNDGSKDGTQEILEDYAIKDKHFRVILQENNGTASARNNGIRESKGRYLMFVDSDDSISEGYFENLLGAALDGNADMAVCGYTTIFDKGKYKRTIRPRGNNDSTIINGCPWGKAIRRELFEHILWPEGYWYEDTILVFLIYPNLHKTVTTDSCEYLYYSSAANTTQSSVGQTKAIDTLYITELVFECMDNLTPPDWRYSGECLRLTVEQFYINHRRLIGQTKECRMELFRLQCRYMQEYYADKSVKSVSNPMYDKALRTGDFNMAERAVRLDKIYKILNTIRR